MNSKKWTISFLIGVLVLLGIFMMANYKCDSVGYFAVEHGQDMWYGNSYIKAEKVKYIKNSFDEYTAFILGGSKSGIVDTNRLEMYTGNKWFNFWYSDSTLQENYIYAKWLIENTNAKKILLYLSGHEINRRYEEEEQNSTTKMPAMVSGNEIDVISESLYYLTLDIDSNKKYIDSTKARSEYAYYDGNTGMIIYPAYQEISNSDGADKWKNDEVLINYSEKLDVLFNSTKNEIISTEESNEAIKDIKYLCEENNVELKVILGPTFLSELSLYESEKFYTYLRSVVNEVPIWNFSGINEINMNPYNFIDAHHCNYALNNLVVDIAYGDKEYGEFGSVLTNDNIDQYIIERKNSINKLKKEYEQTGTVKLNDSYKDRIK